MSTQTPIEPPPVGNPPPSPPKRRRLKVWHWVLIAIGAVVVLGSIGNAVNGGGSTTTKPLAQQQSPQAQQAQPQQPQTPAPTIAPPTPTATSKPLSPQEQLDKTVKDASLLGTVTEATWDEADGMVLVKLDAADAFTNAGIAEKIKMDAYDLFRGIYTSGPTPKLWVILSFYGATTDVYGNTSHGIWATASLAPATAAKFNWSNLTWRTAWPVYDRTSMLPNLANA